MVTNLDCYAFYFLTFQKLVKLQDGKTAIKTEAEEGKKSRDRETSLLLSPPLSSIFPGKPGLQVPDARWGHRRKLRLCTGSNYKLHCKALSLRVHVCVCGWEDVKQGVVAYCYGETALRVITATCFPSEASAPTLMTQTHTLLFLTLDAFTHAYSSYHLHLLPHTCVHKQTNTHTHT